MTQAEADLRMFTHDATVAHHDKDYRCFAAFPSALLQRYCLVMCHISEHHQVSYEHISGLDWDGSSDTVLWFLLRTYAALTCTWSIASPYESGNSRSRMGGTFGRSVTTTDVGKIARLCVVPAVLSAGKDGELGPS